MVLSTQQLNQLSDIALSAVTAAGRYINQCDIATLKAEFKDSGSSRSSQVVTEVDLQSQAIIIEQLQASCDEHDIALLSEENCADTSIERHDRLYKRYFWCIDPLDGTLPYIEGGDGYAVSIALVNKQGKSILCAIYRPAENSSYYTKSDEHGHNVVYKNTYPFKAYKAKKKKRLSVYIDRSFINTPHYQAVINILNDLLAQFKLQALDIISIHGAVVNALSVIENDPAIYIKIPKSEQGGGAVWDFSGTACIIDAVNGWVSDIHGSPLDLNPQDSYYMNQKGVIYASDKEQAKAIINGLSALLQS